MSIKIVQFIINTLFMKDINFADLFICILFIFGFFRKQFFCINQ